MSVGIFLEEEPRPSRNKIAQAVGGKWVLFQALAAFFRKEYHLAGEWIFGGRNYGWNCLYRQSGKTLANLYPQKGFFVAQVVLGREQAEKASTLPMGRNAKDVFSNAPQFHDGRWLFIPVRTRRDVEDVQGLIRLKRKPTRKKG